MPKRVISIGHGESRFKLRLHETTKVDLYCALSYCWGVDQKMKTTKNSLEKFKAEIAFDQLPATIRDAISTTYKLGIRYLFVDSLCIIQDDEDDKRAQIDQMPNIYSEALITIIASRASSVEVGFLHNRPSSLEDLGEYRYGDFFRMPLRCPSGEIDSVILMDSVRRTSCEPLYARAWALQEQLLARRVLEYGSNQTTWSCWSVDGLVDGWLANYSTPESHPRWVPEMFRPYLTQKAVEKVGDNGDQDNQKQILRQWHNLVEKYTTRNLSESGDKLLAIGAIAERVGSALKDHYLAGTWKSRLPNDLLWRVIFKRHSRPEGDRAPSWSWAAVDGEVRTSSSLRQAHSLELVDCRTELVSRDARYGAVKRGHLVVRGRLRRVVVLDVGENAQRNYQGCFRVMEPSRRVTEALVPISFDAVEREFNESIPRAMDVAMLEIHHGDGMLPSGLVLRDLGHQIFSRLGIFNWAFDRATSLSDFRKGPTARERFSDWASGFDECVGTTITIV